jgi:hypothetical protein
MGEFDSESIAGFRGNGAGSFQAMFGVATGRLALSRTAIEKNKVKNAMTVRMQNCIIIFGGLFP